MVSLRTSNDVFILAIFVRSSVRIDVAPPELLAVWEIGDLGLKPEAIVTRLLRSRFDTPSRGHFVQPVVVALFISRPSVMERIIASISEGVSSKPGRWLPGG